MTDHHVNALEPEDFDAWVAETNEGILPASIIIGGRTYVLPIGVPIAFTLQTRKLAEREDAEALREVLRPIFGDEALDEWAATGPFGVDSLPVLLRWAGANMAKPGSLSVREAADAVAAELEGKALNRAARRAKPGKKPRSSGRR